MSIDGPEFANEWDGFDPTTAPIIGRLASGEVVVDRPNSHNHLIEDISRGAAAIILASSLASVNASERDFIRPVVKPPVGRNRLRTRCVETSELDDIVFAYRLGRSGQSRIVLDRQPERTNYISMTLSRSKQSASRMILIAATPGIAEPEPWDRHLTNRSRLAARRVASERFWLRHALILDPMAIDFSRPHGEEPHDLIWRDILDLPKLTVDDVSH